MTELATPFERRCALVSGLEAAAEIVALEYVARLEGHSVEHIMAIQERKRRFLEMADRFSDRFPELQHLRV